MCFLRVAELVECPVGCRSVLEFANQVHASIVPHTESLWNRCDIFSSTFTHTSLARAAPPSLKTPCRCVTADGAAGRPTARGIREPGLQLPLTARQARAQASLRGPHPQPARRPPPVHWVRGVLALRGAVRRLGAPLQGQGQLPARELRRARARGDICDPAQA